jgi:hypothetical protein
MTDQLRRMTRSEPKLGKEPRPLQRRARSRCVSSAQSRGPIDDGNVSFGQPHRQRLAPALDGSGHEGPPQHKYDVARFAIRTSEAQLSCPSGKSFSLIRSKSHLSSPRAKNISLPFFGKSCAYPSCPASARGAKRVVTIVGRDAMDVGGVAGRAAACADGKGVQAWRPSGRCQVSWVDSPRGDGDNKARSLRGEHAISR